MSELSLEFLDGQEAALDDVVPYASEVTFTGLKLARSSSDEVGSGKGGGEIGNEEGCESDVEGENGLDAVCHKEGGMACGSASSYSVSPKDVRRRGGPFRGFAFASLQEGFLDRSMLTLDDTIRSGVVSRNTNVPNVVLVSEPVQSSNIGRTVICDDLLNRTPTTQDFFEYETTYSDAGLRTKRAPFWPCGE